MLQKVDYVVPATKYAVLNMSKFVWNTRGRYFLDLWGFAAVGGRTFATGLTILNEVAFSIEICEV